MSDLVSIPQATAAVVNNAHRATQGMQAVVACIANALGVDRPEASTAKPRSIPEAVQSFANTAQTLANAFGGLADLFERVSEPVQIEAVPEPVQIEQATPEPLPTFNQAEYDEYLKEASAETEAGREDAEREGAGGPDPFCEKEDAIAEGREESISNESTAEPDFLPDGDPVNRMASYESEPSTNGRHGGRATKGRKRKDS